MAAVLLYDRDCGFCTQSARAVHRLRCEVETVPWQEWPGGEALGLTAEAMSERVHLVDGTDVRTGHEAVGATLRRSRLLPVRAAGAVVLAPPLRPLASRVYDWVAEHRHQLPGGTAACAIEPPPRT